MSTESRTVPSTVGEVLNLRFADGAEYSAIVIPDFQRPYCWSEADIQKILDDVDELRWDSRRGVYRDDDYYFGCICFQTKGSALELLDGQQRLTSFAILAKTVIDRARKAEKVRAAASEAARALLEGDDVWRRAVRFRELKTQQHIRTIAAALERAWRIAEEDAEADALEHGEAAEGAPNFYELSLLHALERLAYIFRHGRVAVTTLHSTAEAEQYFQGENNRGKAMELLDILKAYHMRLETDPKRLERIQRIWSAFSEAPVSEEEEKIAAQALKAGQAVQATRLAYVRGWALPAMLMACGVEPWRASEVENAVWLKGLSGTHAGDRLVDEKLRRRLPQERSGASGGKSPAPRRLYDLLDPVQPGLPFFEMLEQYRLIAEAVDRAAFIGTFRGSFRALQGLPDIRYEATILKLALVAWVDRFAKRDAFARRFAADEADEADEEAFLEGFAKTLAADAEFRAYARGFARFLVRLRSYGRDRPGAYGRLESGTTLWLIGYREPYRSLLFLPHRSSSPAACRREFLNRTHPSQFCRRMWGLHADGYREAFALEGQRQTNEDKESQA